MINDIYECKSAKKWALGFYIVFMLNLILAGVMLGIADFAKWNLIMFFAGVFIACSIVSLVVFCALLHEVNTWIKFQKTYYVDIDKIDYLVNHLGFRDECDHLERTCLHNGRAYVLFVDNYTYNTPL